MKSLKEKILKRLDEAFGDKKMKTRAKVVAGVLVVVLLVALVLQYAVEDSYILYRKNDVLMYDGVMSKPQTIGEVVRGHYNYPCVNQDGTRLFYCESEKEDSPLILYYRQMNLPNSKPVQISSGKGNVQSFIINEQGSAVVYNEEERTLVGTLYYSDFTKKQKIATSVYLHEWDMSPDGKRVVWRDVAGDAYFRIIGKEAEKIDSDVQKIAYISEDCKTIWYVKNNNELYKKQINQEKIKIASNIEIHYDTTVEPEIRAVLAYDSGRGYFMKNETEEWNGWDYVIDDFEESDAQMKEPIWEDFFEKYNNKSLAQSEYDIAVKQWEKKQERDKIREYLNTDKETTQTNLYYYDGKNTHIVSKNVGPWIESADDKTTIIYYVQVRDKNQKIQLSDLTYDFESGYASIPWKGRRTVCVAIDGIEKRVDLGNKQPMEIGISANGKIAYALCRADDSNAKSTLYKLKISGNKVKEPELLAYGVEHYGSWKDVYPMKDKLAFVLQRQNGTYDLYVDLKKVDSNLQSGLGVTYYESVDALFYRRAGSHSLMRYQGGKLTKLDEKVYAEFVVTPGGKVFYICKEGKNKVLYLYWNGMSKKIDSGDITLYERNIYTTHRDFWVEYRAQY